MLRRPLVLALGTLVPVSGPAFPDRGRSRGESGDVPRPTVGAFTATPGGGPVHGSTVSFVYDATGVSGFTVGGAPVFTATVVRAVPGATSVESHGAVIQVTAPSYEFRAHDNAAAAAQLDVSDATARLAFASGYSLTSLGGNVLAIG